MKNEGTSIILHQRRYDNVVTLKTSNNDDARNITVTLPNKSGRAATAQELSAGVRVINAPEVLSGEDDAEIAFSLSGYETIGTYNGKHTATQYRVASDSNMNNIIMIDKRTSGDLTNISKPLLVNEHYIQFRYLSGKNASDWSEPVVFKNMVGLLDFSDGSSTSTIQPKSHPDYKQAAYIGIVPGNVCIGDRDNRGILEEYFNAYHAIARDNMGYGVKFPFIQRGWQYTHNGKRYWSKRDQFVSPKTALYKPAANVAAEGAAVNPYSYNADGKTWQVHDGTGKTIVWDPESEHPDNPWELEVDRNQMPTYLWLLYEYIGIGVGLDDKNVDGTTTGGGIGDVVNEGAGWLKMVNRHGKLIYIAKKTACDKISWNCIAKREAAKGKTTVRLGEKLYYIRMLTKEEYEDLLVGCVNGKLRNDNPDEYGLGKFEWTLDFQEGSIRDTIKYDVATQTIVRGAKDPKSRDGTVSYRPVLEYIPEGEEPYNNLPECFPAASRNAETLNNGRSAWQRQCWEAIQLSTGEALQFDKYADTGFFGITTNNGQTRGTNTFVSYQEVRNTTGLTGNVVNNDYAWMKFYWHGIVIYIAAAPMAHTYTYLQITQSGAQYGMDSTPGGMKTVTKNNIKYRIRSATGNRSEPFSDVEKGWAHGNENWNGLKQYLNMGKNSMWLDLFYRLMYNMNGKQGSEQGYCSPYMGSMGGFQQGSNWMSLQVGSGANGKLPMNYCTDGNSPGASYWGPGLCVGGGRVSYCGNHGMSLWWSGYAPSHSDAGVGWRAALVLTN